MTFSLFRFIVKTIYNKKDKQDKEDKKDKVKKTKKTNNTRRKTISRAAKDCRIGGARGEYAKGYRLFRTRIYTDLHGFDFFCVNQR